MRTDPSGAGWIIGETSRASAASPNSRIDTRSEPGSLAGAGSRPASRRRAPLWIQWRNSWRSGAAWTNHPRAEAIGRETPSGLAIADDHGPASGLVADGTLQLARDLLLPVVFRFLVTDRSRAWIHDHHIDWDTPAVSRR